VRPGREGRVGSSGSRGSGRVGFVCGAEMMRSQNADWRCPSTYVMLGGVCEEQKMNVSMRAGEAVPCVVRAWAGEPGVACSEGAGSGCSRSTCCRARPRQLAAPACATLR
jgi:hypothetical protein